MFEKLRELISEQLDLDAEKITPETNIMEDLGADSLDVAELIMNLEDSLHLSIPQDNLKDVHTVADLCEVLEQLK